MPAPMVPAPSTVIRMKRSLPTGVPSGRESTGSAGGGGGRGGRPVAVLGGRTVVPACPSAPAKEGPESRDDLVRSPAPLGDPLAKLDRKSTRLNSSHPN